MRGGGSWSPFPQIPWESHPFVPQVILSPFLLPRFIVVCGNITVDSVTAFLRNFLRHRSGEINMDIVFLGE